jgi:hypothetical protein
MITQEYIDDWFKEHKVTGGHAEAMMNCFKNAATSILNHTVKSPEQTLAVRKLQESVFWAFESAIADRKDPTR